MDAPPLPRSYYASWGEGSGSLDVTVQSAPTSTDPQRIDHAEIIFQQHNNCVLIGAPSDMDSVVDLTSPVHERCLERLEGLASFELTVAGRAISAYIHSTPYLPQSIQDHFINVIFAEAQNSARVAASREHRAVRMVFRLNFSINMIFDDDYDSSAEDGADAGAGNVEMDAAMGGNDAVQPVGLEAVEAVGGLSPEAIANHLAVDNFMGGDPATCVICLQDIARGTQAGWLPCGHVFHPQCVADWLKRSGTCPICRHQLPDIDG